MSNHQPEEIGGNNSVRYQSKYLHISFNKYINKKEFVDFFSSKGLEQIALFRKSNLFVAFIIFDLPKDFKVMKNNFMITSPNYFEDILGPVTLETYSKSKLDFDAAVKHFRANLADNSFNPLIYTEDNFFLNILVKDFDYFKHLFELRNVRAMNDDDFKHHIVEFKLTSQKLEEVIINYRNTLNEFNSILLLKKEPTMKSVLDIKLDRSLDIAQPDLLVSQNQSPQTNEILNLQNIKLLEDPAETTKSIKPLVYEGFMLEYKPVIMEMSKKDEYSQIPKILSIENQEKTLKIFEKDMVDKQSLEFLINLDQLSLRFMIDVYQSKTKISLSRNNKKVLRLISMYVGKKAPPKSSDPNLWIIDLKNNMPNTLLKFYKKLIKNI